MELWAWRRLVLAVVMILAAPLLIDWTTDREWWAWAGLVVVARTVAIVVATRELWTLRPGRVDA